LAGPGVGQARLQDRRLSDPERDDHGLVCLAHAHADADADAGADAQADADADAGADAQADAGADAQADDGANAETDGGFHADASSRSHSCSNIHASAVPKRSPPNAHPCSDTPSRAITRDTRRTV
jgi:hypothetical protein